MSLSEQVLYNMFDTIKYQAELRKENECLKKQNKQLENLLKFYIQKSNYQMNKQNNILSWTANSDDNVYSISNFNF